MGGPESHEEQVGTEHTETTEAAPVAMTEAAATEPTVGPGGGPVGPGIDLNDAAPQAEEAEAEDSEPGEAEDGEGEDEDEITEDDDEAVIEEDEAEAEGAEGEGEGGSAA
jgi:hypothetical protein